MPDPSSMNIRIYLQLDYTLNACTGSSLPLPSNVNAIDGYFDMLRYLFPCIDSSPAPHEPALR
jgi:hypothetical protein